jgi:hypothetical protein
MSLFIGGKAGGLMANWNHRALSPPVQLGREPGASRGVLAGPAKTRQVNSATHVQIEAMVLLLAGDADRAAGVALHVVQPVLGLLGRGRDG